MVKKFLCIFALFVFVSLDVLAVLVPFSAFPQAVSKDKHNAVDKTPAKTLFVFIAVCSSL